MNVLNTSRVQWKPFTEEQESKYQAWIEADAELHGFIHAHLRSAPIHNKAWMRRYDSGFLERQEKRDAALAAFLATNPAPNDYRGKVVARAQGHPDLESTQAARRICAKRGFAWE